MREWNRSPYRPTGTAFTDRGVRRHKDGFVIPVTEGGALLERWKAGPLYYVVTGTLTDFSTGECETYAVLDRIHFKHADDDDAR